MAEGGGVCVIGVGNPERGDDGVGPAVIERLRDRVAADVSLAAVSGEPGELVDRLGTAGAVWIVDAATGGGAPGTVHWLDAGSGGPVPARPGASSHGLGVVEALALAQALGRLPDVCRIVAIEGEGFGLGTGLSAPVSGAVDAVVEQLRAEIAGVGNMHETALMTDLVARIRAIAEAENAARVVSVSVRVGALSHFTRATFVTHFREAARGSPAAAAMLNVTVSTDTTDPRAGDVVLTAVEVDTADDPVNGP